MSNVRFEDDPAEFMRRREVFRQRARESARSQALTAELRTAKTKGERDRAVQTFMSAQKSPESVRFAEFLRNPGHEYRAMSPANTNPDLMQSEYRAASVGTNTAGGFLVPPGWYSELLYLAREYSGIMSGFGTFETQIGGTVVQPSYSAFTATTNVGENVQVTDGPYTVIGQRSWPEAKVYSGSVTASVQLVSDYGADGTLETFVKRGLAEAIGRSLAPDAASTVYTAVGGSSTTVNLTAARALNLDSGATTELTGNGLTIQTYSAMWKALDPTYKPTAVWKLNPSQADALSRVVDNQGRYQIDPSTGIAKLFNRPIIETNSVSDLTASTASGPLLMSSEFAFSQRVVTGDALFLASNEARAEFAEMYYRAVFRSSFMAADPAACVGVIPAAT